MLASDPLPVLRVACGPGLPGPLALDAALVAGLAAVGIVCAAADGDLVVRFPPPR
jgi:hypothetical protein